VVYYPEKKPWFEQLMSDFGENVKLKILQTELGENFAFYKQAEKLKDYQGIQVRMPVDYIVK
jgi:protease-4